MLHWFNILAVTLVGFLILIFAGWGVTSWLLPQQLHNRFYILLPFSGLYAIDTLSHITFAANIPGYQAIWILLVVIVLVNGAALIRRRQFIRWPNLHESMLLLLALPALGLSLLPLFPQGELIAVGNTNADAISHSIASDWLQNNSFDDPFQKDSEHPANSPVNYKIKIRHVRLGFHFYQMYLDILTGRQGYETFSVVTAIGFYLWSVATGFFAGSVLRSNRAVTFLSALLFSLSGLPLWIGFGGFGPQVLGMGLMVMAFGLWALALNSREWRTLIFAGAFSGTFGGIYSDALPYLVVPVGLLVVLLVLKAIRERNFQGLRDTVIRATIGMLLVFLLSPISTYRAMYRSLRVATNEFPGNVSFWVTLRQVFGLVPFGPELSQWAGDNYLLLMSIVVVLLIIIAAFGLLRLLPRSRLIAVSFILPHLLSIIWFRFNGQPYYYFKSWSMGWFIYLILALNGFAALWHLEPRRKITRTVVVLALIVLSFIFTRTSWMLSNSVSNSNALTPNIIELREWVSLLNPDEEIFIATSDLSPISVFWIAYFLVDHPIHIDETPANTSYDPYIYQDEPWVIAYMDRNSSWNRPIWLDHVVRQNGDFSLFRLDQRDDRHFEIPKMQHEVGAMLDDRIELLGYDLEPDQLIPGSDLEIRLYWLTHQKSDEDYKVFIHLLDQEGNLIQQVDDYPLNWSYNTYFWLPGEIITDPYHMALKSELPPGEYTLKVGMYLVETGQRLPVTLNGRPFPENAINLTPALRISPPEMLSVKRQEQL